jgi:iron complex transport system substrate-binding protein
MHKRTSSLLALAVLLFAAACAQAPIATPTASPEPVRENTPIPPSPTEEVQQPFTITDALAREVTFAEPPQRIVVAGRATTLLLNALYMYPEASQRLVAFEQRSQTASPFLVVANPNLGEKTTLEMNASAEQIAPLHPDAVLMKTYMRDSLGVTLEELDIPTVYLDLETPESFLRDMAMLGQLFGNPERAEEITAFYQERLDRLETLMAGLTDEVKPSVLMMQYSDKGGEVAFNVPPASWLQTTMVTLAGGLPIWTEASETGGWTVVGFEQIAAWNPDLIFVIYYSGDSTEIADMLAADANWQALDAVWSGQLLGFPGDFLSWDQPDPRWILGLSWLATQVQPTLTGEIDIMDEVQSFYSEMYLLSPEAIEADVLPLVHGIHS